MSRVTSKSLFNYPLKGILAEDAKIVEAMAKEAEQADPVTKKLKEMADRDDPSVDVKVIAEYTRRVLGGMAKFIHPIQQAMIDQCIHTEFKVPIRDGNDFEVPVLVHTPKRLSEEKSNAAIIYAHAGGMVGGEAHMFKGRLSHLAIEAGVVFFNVDYRLAPETKFPKNIMDFYCAVKHIVENASKLGIDASRIAIAGDSGGGGMCFATMVMLAQKNEGNLIKLSIPGVAQISDYCFSDRSSMTDEERELAVNVKKLWGCIANDLKVEGSNPLLFPAKASNDILQKMPPTIIWEHEFDMFITENTRIAHRMKVAGRLLEFRVHPGMTHMSTFAPGTKGYEDDVKDFKLAMKEYLL